MMLYVYPCKLDRGYHQHPPEESHWCQVSSTLGLPQGGGDPQPPVFPKRVRS